MAIERGVDDIDIDELDIEDNSKEILISDESEDDLIPSLFDGIEAVSYTHLTLPTTD